MSYTPMAEDAKEYLKQIARGRDAMLTALNSESVRVPEGVREVASRQVEDAYKTIEFWLKYHVTK